MPGGLIDVVVPTGNFGNILAAYYAKEMGLPIGKLICASNENKVLFDFFTTGKYNKNREFTLTSSPSMDILVSSNLERLIYAISGEDAKKNLELMKSLNEKGEYEITPSMKERMKDFIGGWATEEDTTSTIADVFAETGYTLDPHTAVAAFVGKKHSEEVKETADVTEDEEDFLVSRMIESIPGSYRLVVSTASPYKFIGSVMSALDSKYQGQEELDLVKKLEMLSDVKIPKVLSETLEAPINKEIYCQIGEMKDIVKKILES
jgi:threonine synthase